MFKKMSLPFLAFLQTTGLVLYITGISSFFMFITPTADKPVTKFYAPIIMLLTFVISAVVSATLVLGRAGVYFWDKKYKEAFTLVGWTVGWGLLYFVLFVFLLFLS